MTLSPEAIRALDAVSLTAAVRAGTISAVAVTEAYLDRIAAREDAVRAWQYLSPEQALAAARALDGRGARGPLAGLPVAVKDVIATHDMPTGYGNASYAGTRTVCDAPCVALTRAGDGIVLGKSVTTEFAMASPGKTRNPFDPGRTPGGSSSGSCAAVGAGMALLGFGTQTAGSVIRPASYCGVVGYKPTHGLINPAEVKVLAQSLDTIGLLTRTVADAGLAASVLGRRPDLFPVEPAGRLRVGLFRPAPFDKAGPGTIAALEAAEKALRDAGVEVAALQTPDWFIDCHLAHHRVMGFEVTAALAYERLSPQVALTGVTRDFLAVKEGVTAAEYDAALAFRDEHARRMAALMEGIDVLLAPSAPDVAPVGLDSTGDPVFNTPWTLFRMPALTLPAIRWQGLPVGVQVIGRRGADRATLAAAARVEAALACDWTAA
ncbi:amidase [Paenirhodobacter populi]|uniref:Amidase n=1 Tax=Paenirhodobacter populi TaxID=2306993 RepID=A0A443J252_9RHOB|nr:amidase [Sinirhodobacter populi]RWR14406.1 amidase [Sinirhodobacter populi]